MTSEEIRKRIWKGNQLELEVEKVAQLAELNEKLSNLTCGESDDRGEALRVITYQSRF